MYCHNAAVEKNRLARNSVGAFLMYGSRLHLAGNRVVQNRRANGFGIGLKDMQEASLDGNLISNNRVGLFFDNSTGIYERNLLAFNDAAVQILPSARNNLFSENSFVENTQQVLIEGQGTGSLNRWQGRPGRPPLRIGQIIRASGRHELLPQTFFGQSGHPGD